MKRKENKDIMNEPLQTNADLNKDVEYISEESFSNNTPEMDNTELEQDIITGDYEDAETFEEDNNSLDGMEIEIPKTFQPCKNKDEIPEKDLYLTTAAVTKMLGISHRNVIIRYTGAFYDLLAVKKDPINNHYLYTEESVKQLAFIINDVRNSGRSFKLEKEFLESSDGKKVMSVASDNVGTLEKMFTQMQQNIIESNNAQWKEIRTLLSEAAAPTIEDKSLIQIEERMSKQEEILKTIVEQKDEEIRLLKEQLAQKKKPFWKR